MQFYDIFSRANSRYSDKGTGQRQFDVDGAHILTMAQNYGEKIFHDITQPGMDGNGREGKEGAQLVAAAVPSATD